jgi:hypothetical protein
MISLKDVFRLHVEYNPSEKNDWFFCINRADGLMLVQGFLRQMTTDEFKDYTAELSCLLEFQLELVTSNIVEGVIYRSDITQSVYDDFFNPLIERGMKPEEYETVLCHFWDKDEQFIKITGKLKE